MPNFSILGRIETCFRYWCTKACFDFHLSNQCTILYETIYHFTIYKSYTIFLLVTKLSKLDKFAMYFSYFTFSKIESSQKVRAIRTLYVWSVFKCPYLPKLSFQIRWIKKNYYQISKIDLRRFCFCHFDCHFPHSVQGFAWLWCTFWSVITELPKFPQLEENYGKTPGKCLTMPDNSRQR